MINSEAVDVELYIDKCRVFRSRHYFTYFHTEHVKNHLNDTFSMNIPALCLELRQEKYHKFLPEKNYIQRAVDHRFG